MLQVIIGTVRVFDAVNLRILILVLSVAAIGCGAKSRPVLTEEKAHKCSLLGNHIVVVVIRQWRSGPTRVPSRRRCGWPGADRPGRTPPVSHPRLNP